MPECIKFQHEVMLRYWFKFYLFILPSLSDLEVSVMLRDIHIKGMRMKMVIYCSIYIVYLIDG